MNRILTISGNSPTKNEWLANSILEQKPGSRVVIATLEELVRLQNSTTRDGIRSVYIVSSPVECTELAALGDGDSFDEIAILQGDDKELVAKAIDFLFRTPKFAYYGLKVTDHSPIP